MGLDLPLRKWWLALRGPLTVLVAMGVAESMARLMGPEANLQRVVIVAVLAAVIYTAAQWGRRLGIVSGLLGGAYTVYFFATFSSRDEMSLRLSLGIVIGLLVLGLALLVGTLRTRADRATRRAIESERERTSAAERARLELQAKADELQETNAALERVNRNLASVNEGLESFAYVVSHDLKEPVRAMAAYLEDAENRAADPEARDALAQARNSNDRLSRLLQGLLEVARATHVDSHDLKSMHPIEVLESDVCTARYRGLQQERGARIESSCLLGTPPVLATEEHLCQVLGNLVINAIRHNDKTSPLVRVRVQPQDAEASMVEVIVEDDGPGFDTRVVDQLGRVRPGRPAMIRGGFGLVIVRRAVERLGGEFWIGQSADLGGALVHFTLPAATSRWTLPEPSGRERETPSMESSRGEGEPMRRQL